MFFSSKNSEKYRALLNLFYIVYSIIMFIVYYGYVLLDRHRLIQSKIYISKPSLTQQDSIAIERLGNLISYFERSFLYLFIIALLIILTLFRKDIKVNTHFLLLNMSLFGGIALINEIIFRVTHLPIGNLMQPLFVPSYILLGAFIYVLCLWVYVRQNKYN